MTKILSISLIFLSLFSCPKKVPEPDNPPEIISKSPTSSVLEQKVGDTIEFEITAIDADDDPIDYRTLVDGMKVNDSNTYTFVVPDLGTYTVQMDAYNDEIDSEIWTVNVGNTNPVIGYLSNVTGKEDQIVKGSTVKTANISDHEDSLEDLVVELSQTNESLIKLALDDDYNIIIEDYTADGNGSSEVTIKVTDTNGGVTEKSFTYNITPMTDIEGEILDSDTWEPNTALQGFAIINGDTTWADANGKYKTQIDPASSINIEAGYRSLDKANPMSFITTARSIGANNDVTGADIMVVTYLNNNLTPEEFRIMAWETNFGDGNYTGAKVPSISMTDKIITSGNPAIDWAGEEYLEEMTAEEIVDIKRVIADSINIHQKYPFPLEEVEYYEGVRDENNMITWEKQRWENPSAASGDYNNDGIRDYVHIVTDGIHEGIMLLFLIY